MYNIFFFYFKSDLSSEELIVLSVIPEKSYVTFQPGKEHSFKLTTRTKVIFMSTQYRIAFALDLSPSVSSLVSFFFCLYFLIVMLQL